MATRDTSSVIHTITLSQTEFDDLRSIALKMRKSYFTSTPVTSLTAGEVRLAADLFGKHWWEN